MKKKDNKIVLLHIGRGKTGTTAIQSFCTMNREMLKSNGIHYVQAGDAGGGHQAFAKSLIKEIPAWMEKSSSSTKIQAEVRKELSESGAVRFLISSENFTLVDPEAVRLYFQEIFEQFVVRVIFFARSQDELSESQYNQDVKWSGEVASFRRYIDERRCEEMEFDTVLQPWEASFGRENIIARVYDGAARSVLFDFLSTLPLEFGCKSEEYAEAPDWNNTDFSNASVGFMAVEVFRILNHFKIPAKRKLYSSIYENTRKTDSPAIHFSSQEAREYRLSFRESNLRFSNRYLNGAVEELGGRRYSDVERDALLLYQEQILGRPKNSSSQ